MHSNRILPWRLPPGRCKKRASGLTFARVPGQMFIREAPILHFILYSFPKIINNKFLAICVTGLTALSGAFAQQKTVTIAGCF